MAATLGCRIRLNFVLVDQNQKITIPLSHRLVQARLRRPQNHPLYLHRVQHRCRRNHQVHRQARSPRLIPRLVQLSFLRKVRHRPQSLLYHRRNHQPPSLPKFRHLRPLPLLLQASPRHYREKPGQKSFTMISRLQTSGVIGSMAFLVMVMPADMAVAAYTPTVDLARSN